MAGKTTPPLPFRIGEALPHVAATEARCLRLHPRRVSRPSPAAANKIGGRILWPQSEAWPQCREHGAPFDPVLQLRREDFPMLPFPGDADLLQLLWCPELHFDTFEPEGQDGFRLVWRRRDAAPHPEPARQIQNGPRRNELIECELHPEPVPDYPDFWQQTPAACKELAGWNPPDWEVAQWLGARRVAHSDSASDSDWDWLDGMGVEGEAYAKVRASRTRGARFYQSAIGPVPGTKLLGHAAWVQSGRNVACSRGHSMRLLFQMDSCEMGPDTSLRWCPQEDWAEAERQSALVWDSDIACPHHVMLGDVGRLFVFVCEICPARPVRFELECS